MPQENVELVRQVVEATNRRDAEAFVATLSPDVEWEDAVYWTEGPERTEALEAAGLSE
jgi:ketosteroid isomerase-like protein